MQASELFGKESIEVCDSWIDIVERDRNEEWREFLEEEEVSSKLCDDNSRNIEQNMDIDQNSGDSSYDGWCAADERPAGVTDTLLQEPDSTESVDKIINVAPGEGSTALGLFIVKDSEFLAFPTIFCGQRRCDNRDRIIPVHYSTICKWEVRNRDRRVAHSNLQVRNDLASFILFHLLIFKFSLAVQLTGHQANVSS